MKEKKLGGEGDARRVLTRSSDLKIIQNDHFLPPLQGN